MGLDAGEKLKYLACLASLPQPKRVIDTAYTTHVYYKYENETNRSIYS
jgi:hypothetical protein